MSMLILFLLKGFEMFLEQELDEIAAKMSKKHETGPVVVRTSKYPDMKYRIENYAKCETIVEKRLFLGACQVISGVTINNAFAIRSYI